MTSGQGCGSFTLLVPGTSVTGAKIDESGGDCRTTIQFNPDPAWIGRPLVLENYIVRLLPGETYTVTVTRDDGTWAPTLTVYAGGQVRAQRLPDGSSSHTVELTPAALTYYTLEVSAAAAEGPIPVVGYSISVSGGSGPVAASVAIPSGPIELTVPGDTVHARAQVTRSGATVQGAQVRWESLNPAVAQVAPNGVVTAVAPRSTTLRASWGAGVATVPVTVDPTKFALVPQEGGATSAGSFAGFRLRTGSFPPGVSARLEGAPTGSTVDDGTLFVWVPLGGSGTLELSVEATVGGVLRSGTRSIQRAAIPTPSNPSLYLTTLSQNLDGSLRNLRPGGGGSGSGGAARDRNVDRMAGLLTSGNNALGQLTDEQKAVVATLLAADASGDFSAVAPAAAVSIPLWCKNPATIVTRAGHRACAEAVLAAQAAAMQAVRRQETLCASAVRLESLGSILSTLETLTLKAKACVRWFALSVSQEPVPVESPIIQRRIRSRDTAWAIRGVAGESPARSTSPTEPLIFRSGVVSPLHLAIESSNPTAADGGTPLGRDVVTAVGILEGLWSRLRALVDSSLESEAPAFRGTEAVTLLTGAERSEVRLVSVGRQGIEGELVDVNGGGVGLRLRGPSSGNETFFITVETANARAGTVRAEIPVRLQAGYPDIVNAWIHGWFDIQQDPLCNSTQPNGVNARSRIRVQLSGPMPETGRFLSITDWGSGSGSIYKPVDHFQRVGENLYQIDGYVYCWGGPGGSLHTQLQYEAPDGTRTNAFRFFVPRP